jgi:hypothetical protein
MLLKTDCNQVINAFYRQFKGFNGVYSLILRDCLLVSVKIAG